MKSFGYNSHLVHNSSWWKPELAGVVPQKKLGLRLLTVEEPLHLLPAFFNSTCSAYSVRLASWGCHLTSCLSSLPIADSKVNPIVACQLGRRGLDANLTNFLLVRGKPMKVATPANIDNFSLRGSSKYSLRIDHPLDMFRDRGHVQEIKGILFLSSFRTVTALSL